MVSDDRADGAKPWVRWETSYGRRGVCKPANGRASAHCNYNLRENERIRFRLELHGGGRFTAYGWLHAKGSLLDAGGALACVPGRVARRVVSSSRGHVRSGR